MELQYDSNTNIITDLNKDSYDWKYKPVKGINIFHFRDRIYVTQNLRKRVLKWYQCYLQHPGGYILAHALTTICRWLGIVDQSRKLWITYKYCQKFKKRNAKYGLPPVKDAETLTPWNTVCVYLIESQIILSKAR